MQREEDRVHEMMQQIAAGNDVGNKLAYDPVTKTVRPASASRDPDKAIVVTPKDMEHFGTMTGGCEITLSDELLTGHDAQATHRIVQLARWDDGHVFNSFVRQGLSDCVQGTISFVDDPSRIPIESVGLAEDVVRVLAPCGWCTPDSAKSLNRKDTDSQIQGYVRRGITWEASPVRVVSVGKELASRSIGLFETNVFSGKEVFIAGQGSGGAPIGFELAKQGLNLTIMDHDRIEVGNIGRHHLGLSQVGRYKVDAMADAIRDKNPFIRIRASRSKICRETVEEVRACVRRADLVICGIDEPTGKKLLNRICLEENKPFIIAGVFRRAYGGQILRVRPGRTPCYQCFLMNLPEAAEDHEVANLREALRIAYSDRPVAIEPGLSNDIGPVSTMVVTLAIQLLLEGNATSLSSRDEDLVAPWYLWLNRREPETEYEKLEPLEFNIDGMHILRWYGIAMARRSDCPCCGDFVGQKAQEAGLAVTSEDADAFKCD